MNPRRGIMTRDENIACEEALRRLATFLDGELEEQESAEIRRHLEICRSCYSRAEFERRLKKKIQGELRRSTVPNEFEARIRELLGSLPEKA